MRTIQELNQKWWYRAIKVIFTFIFLISIIFYNIYIFTSISFLNIDNRQTEIVCNYWDQKSFSPASQKIVLDNYDFNNHQFDYKYFFENYNSYIIKDIFDVCSDKKLASDVDIFAMQRWYELGLHLNDEIIPDKQMREITEIEGKWLDSEKTPYLDYSIKFFEIHPVFTIWKWVSYFEIGNALIIIIFETIKRAFYYIVLGTSIPKK